MKVLVIGYGLLARRKKMKVKYLLIGMVVLFVTGMLATQSYAKIDPKNVVASWLFDDGSGNKAKDSSGNGNDGTVTGAKWVNGRKSKALEFDGASYVLADIKVVPQILTLEAWIYPIAGGGVVFAELGQGAINSGWHDSQMEILSSGEFKVGCWTGVETGISLGIYKFSAWYHVVMTYDKTNIKGYVNGELKKSLAAVKQYPPDLWYAIGAADTTSLGEGRYFNGIIDQAALYDIAISDDDVKQNFKVANAVFPSGKLTSTWAGIKAK
jgi:hypothetical protein